MKPSNQKNSQIQNEIFGNKPNISLTLGMQVGMMPGMQPLNGPHGLESILKAYETSSLDGTII